LLVRYAALRVAAQELAKASREWQAKLARLAGRSTLGRVAAQTAWRDDALDELFAGTPEEQADRAVGRVEGVVREWAEELDRYDDTTQGVLR
jgi:hypothetical protein